MWNFKLFSILETSSFWNIVDSSMHLYFSKCQGERPVRTFWLTLNLKQFILFHPSLFFFNPVRAVPLGFGYSEVKSMRGQGVKQKSSQTQHWIHHHPLSTTCPFSWAFSLLVWTQRFQCYSNLEAANSFPPVIEMLCSYPWSVLLFLPIPRFRFHGPVLFTSITLASLIGISSSSFSFQSLQNSHPKITDPSSIQWCFLTV